MQRGCSVLKGEHSKGTHSPAPPTWWSANASRNRCDGSRARSKLDCPQSLDSTVARPGISRTVSAKVEGLGMSWILNFLSLGIQAPSQTVIGRVQVPSEKVLGSLGFKNSQRAATATAQLLNLLDDAVHISPRALRETGARHIDGEVAIAALLTAKRDVDIGRAHLAEHTGRCDIDIARSKEPKRAHPSKLPENRNKKKSHKFRSEDKRIYLESPIIVPQNLGTQSSVFIVGSWPHYTLKWCVQVFKRVWLPASFQYGGFKQAGLARQNAFPASKML